MSKPNRVFIRTYCECGCDCPNCHKGNPGAVEKCVYCQLKWANKGQYNLEYRKKQGWGLPSEHPGYTPIPEELVQINGHWYRLEPNHAEQ